MRPGCFAFAYSYLTVSGHSLSRYYAMLTKIVRSGDSRKLSL